MGTEESSSQPMAVESQEQGDTQQARDMPSEREVSQSRVAPIEPCYIMLAERIEPCPCPADDVLCDYNPPPPPPPAKPSHLTYTPFSESAKIKVSWPSVYGANYYQLQRYLNGTWSTVYSGGQTSVEVSQSGDGLYRFQVRACGNGGCSAFQSYGDMRISNGPVRTEGGTLKALVYGTLGYEDLPSLGLGYDRLRQEVTQNNCLDMSTATTSSQSARTKDYRFSLVQTRDELSTALSLTRNLGVSAKYGNFSGSYSGKKELLANTSRVEDTSVVVVSLRDQFRVVNLTNPSSLPISTHHVDLLWQGEQGKYRNRCGDGYIYSIAYGRQAYFTLQIKSFNYSSSEIRTQTNNLKLDIGSWVSAGYDSTKRTEITQKYSKYQVEARVVSFGSSIPASTVTDLPTAMQYMQSFESEPLTSEYPIDFKTLDYELPPGVSASMYPDYRPYQTVLQRWYDFDRQLATRCEPFDENLHVKSFNMDTDAKAMVNGLSLRQACFEMKRAVQENIQKCEDTTKWSQCIQPDSSSCSVAGSSLSCLSFANRFPVWLTTSRTLRLDKDLGGGLSSKSETVRADACFSTPVIRDQRVESLDCSGQGGCPSSMAGVTVVTEQLHRARNGWNSWSPSTRCLQAEATIERPGWFKSGAHIHQSQTISGLYPEFRSYLF